MTTAGTEFTWVNHAGFLLRSGSTGLLTDPWVTGTAFDDGWAHYSESSFGDEVVAATTHVWFSHEHPDHFSPASLRLIPEADRARITVLYQPTRDGKVLEFCARMGFGCVTLPAHRWFELGPDCSVMLLPWSSGDSMLAIRTPSGIVLNCNDAVISDAASMRRALAPLGGSPVEVLLTQFSYANWEGNPADVHRRVAAAASQAGRPRGAVRGQRSSGGSCRSPASSGSATSENDYLNDRVNTVGDAVQAIRARTTASPVVLRPGERWTVGRPHDPSEAVAGYHADLEAAVSAGRRTTSRRVEPDELVSTAAEFLRRLREINGRRTMALLARTGTLGDAHIWLSDLETGLTLRPDGLSPDAAVGPESADILLSSEALWFALAQMYGGATLNVNGRFREPEGGEAALPQLRAHLEPQRPGVLGAPERAGVRPTAR